MHKVDVDSLLKDFMAERATPKIHRILTTCLALLHHEFNLSEDKEGMLVFPSSLGFHCKTIACKILEQLALPTTLDFLLARLREIKPELAIQPDKIQASTIADKERFFSIGETGSFGLAVWRRAGKKLSAQSVEALAIKFLRLADVLLDIDEILSYIRQYRLITPAELSIVLRRSAKDTFIVFSNDMVGLKHKNYAGEIIYLSPAK